MAGGQGQVLDAYDTSVVAQGHVIVNFCVAHNINQNF